MKVNGGGGTVQSHLLACPLWNHVIKSSGHLSLDLSDGCYRQDLALKSALGLAAQPDSPAEAWSNVLAKCSLEHTVAVSFSCVKELPSL